MTELLRLRHQFNGLVKSATAGRGFIYPDDLPEDIEEAFQRGLVEGLGISEILISAAIAKIKEEGK
jgi:hypothetical protein